MRDAARGVLLAAAEGAVGRAYLLVNDEPVTQRDYLGAIARELGVPAPTRRIPYRPALMVGAALEAAARMAPTVESWPRNTSWLASTSLSNA